MPRVVVVHAAEVAAQALRGGGCGGFAAAIGGSVKNNGDGDEGDPREEQERIARGLEEVARNRTHNQRQANANGKGDGETRHICKTSAELFATEVMPRFAEVHPSSQPALAAAL